MLGLSRVIGAVLLLMLVALPCSFLGCVLTSAAQGEIDYILWSGNPFLTIAYSAARWLACLLAGPVLFIGLDFVYWLNCGEAGLVDWLILIELGVVAGAYWIFALLSVTDRGRLRDINPLAVVDLAHRLGWRALLVVLLAALLLLAHGAVLVAGITELHRKVLLGLVLLIGGWFSGVFWSTFFCRLLGVWLHRARVAPVEEEPAEAVPAGEAG
jgi:hypothetical protein